MKLVPNLERTRLRFWQIYECLSLFCILIINNYFVYASKELLLVHPNPCKFHQLYLWMKVADSWSNRGTNQPWSFDLPSTDNQVTPITPSLAPQPARRTLGSNYFITYIPQVIALGWVVRSVELNGFFTEPHEILILKWKMYLVVQTVERQ